MVTIKVPFYDISNNKQNDNKEFKYKKNKAYSKKCQVTRYLNIYIM